MRQRPGGASWRPGSSAQSMLPITGLNRSDGVAVDAAGEVYVTNSGVLRSNNQVLELRDRLDYPGRAADHRPRRAPRCGGGHRRQRLHHRHQQPRVLKLAGRLEHPESCCRSPALTLLRAVWPWTSPATSTSSTASTRPQGRVLELAAESSTRRADPPEPPRQGTFVERVDVDQGPSVGESVDQVTCEEVHGEATVFKDVIAVRGSAP